MPGLMRPASEAVPDPAFAGGVVLAGAGFFLTVVPDGFGAAAALRDADGRGDAFTFTDGVGRGCPAAGGGGGAGGAPTVRPHTPPRRQPRRASEPPRPRPTA
ncbi:hypothetical protein ACFWIJ_42585, partial [Streptomyces sp. NPDC127079]